MATNTMEPIFVRPAEAARLTGLSRQQLAALAREGKLVRYRPSSNVTLYKVEDLKELIEKSRDDVAGQ